MRKKFCITGGCMAHFSIGDRIVYPSVGVGEIVGIISRTIGAVQKEFYQIQVDDKHAQLMIPVESSERVGVRHLVNTSTISKLFRRMSEAPDRMTLKAWAKKFRTYEERLKSGDPFEAAEVLRDLLIQARRKELSFGEKKVLEQARMLLVRELAFSMEQDEDQIMEEVQARVEKAFLTLPTDL